MKGWVPSIGSTTQMPCPGANSVRPVSSPRKASSGNLFFEAIANQQFGVQVRLARHVLRAFALHL